MNLKEPFVITISREIGSGGHTVGQMLAEKLDTRFCDKDLIRSLEKKFNLSMSAIEKLKGEKKNWLTDIINFLKPVPSAKALGVDPKFTQEFLLDVTRDGNPPGDCQRRLLHHCRPIRLPCVPESSQSLERIYHRIQCLSGGSCHAETGTAGRIGPGSG